MGKGSFKIAKKGSGHSIGLVQPCKWSGKEKHFIPDFGQCVVWRTKAALQINKGAAVFWKFVIKPFQNVISQKQQFIGMVFRIMPIQKINCPNKIQIFH